MAIDNKEPLDAEVFQKFLNDPVHQVHSRLHAPLYNTHGLLLCGLLTLCAGLPGPHNVLGDAAACGHISGRRQLRRGGGCWWRADRVPQHSHCGGMMGEACEGLGAAASAASGWLRVSVCALVSICSTVQESVLQKGSARTASVLPNLRPCLCSGEGHYGAVCRRLLHVV